MLDTASQARYRSLAIQFCRRADGAIVLFDCASSESFDGAQRWVSELRLFENPEQQIILFGKTCIDQLCEVHRTDCESYAAEEGLPYALASAEEIDTVVQTLTRAIVRARERSARGGRPRKS